MPAARILLILSLYCGSSFAQVNPPPDNYEALVKDSTAKIYVSDIIIEGNKKTKRYLIEREMRLKKGDSVLAHTLQEKLQRSQELIYNTTLFTDVTLVPSFISAQQMQVQVRVKEKWYIYPTPQFQLIDRNINEWLNTYNADPERIVYGAKFAHYNLSGRRDHLKLTFLNGYTRNFAFSYSAPYSNKNLTEGFTIGAGYTQNRELTYKTSPHNLPLRYTGSNFIRKNFMATASYVLRRGFYRRHSFALGYSYTEVSDSINSFYNPRYFNTGKNRAAFTDLSYSYQYINTNNVNYPLKGKVLTLTIAKRGLGWHDGLNMLSAEANYNRYFTHSAKWYSMLQTHVKLKTNTGAYLNQAAMGYGDFYLQGLEKYVIDGFVAALARYSLKRKIVSFKIPVPFSNKHLSDIPITIFAKTYANSGFSGIQKKFDTKLGNRLLYSGGLGIDVLTLYDLNFRIEYSFNQLGEKGLFLHAKGGF